jgi:Ni,Fe-hydrogenase III small subunit
MPEPKLVFAIGSCACGGGIWHDTYNVIGPVEKVIPVNYYIPGCPPRPEAIVYGVALALGLVKKNVVPAHYHPIELPVPRYHPDKIIDINGWQTFEDIERV